MNMNTPRIETERLILRKFTQEDIEALYCILKDEEVNTFLPWFPLKSMAEARAFFEARYAPKYRQARGYQYAICFKDLDAPIGYLGISMEEGHDLGYGLMQEFWHRGIVTEAGSAVLAQAKRDGLPYVTATHDVNNPNSGGVMRKLGMKYRYSYQEQWQPKDILVTFRMYQKNLHTDDAMVYQKYWNESQVHFVEPGL